MVDQPVGETTNKLQIALDAPEGPSKPSETEGEPLAPEDYLDPDWVDLEDNEGPPWGFDLEPDLHPIVDFLGD